jgi:hypothetical protein
MKKKTSLWTLAGLVLAAGAWRKFSEDLPIDGVIIPPAERPPAPTCGNFQEPKWDPVGQRWRCVPKGVL